MYDKGKVNRIIEGTFLIRSDEMNHNLKVASQGR